MTSEHASIEHMFSETSVYQAYLDVEVALANAQAKQGIIPEEAAATIRQFANIELLDMEVIHEGLNDFRPSPCANHLGVRPSMWP